MPKPRFFDNWQRAVVVASGAILLVITISCLYWAQAVLIPVVLAIFLTFLLTPVVSVLEKLRLGRTPSVVVVVVFTALAMVGVGWVVTSQITGLIGELPQYADNIKQKIRSVREMSNGPMSDDVERLVADVKKEFNKDESADDAQGAPGGSVELPEEPVSVVVQPESTTWISGLPGALGALMEPLGVAGLVIIMAIFMLIKREDLRNRIIRLAGHGRLTLTTKAVDDASRRISRYLLTQLVINASYGATLGAGLFLIGLQYAFLWGFLAALLRYIPYVGAWVAGSMPALLSLAVFPGWYQPLLVLGLILVLELVSNNVLEPWLYGHSMGVSEVALLVSAAFWAWMWGPIGLIMSGPLTVCLVVLGKYVPQLKYFDVLLGDEPALEPDVAYYQRLLAMDREEAMQIVEKQLTTDDPKRVYDELLLPALVYQRRDYERDVLTDEERQYILDASRDILESLLGKSAAWSTGKGDSPQENVEVAELPRLHILGCPARDEEDELALTMLRQILNPLLWELEITPAEILTSELLERIEQTQPSLICIASLPPGGLSHTRYLCKRLRTQCPETKIIVWRWSQDDDERDKWTSLEVEDVGFTLLEARDKIGEWHGVLSSAAVPAKEIEAAVSSR